MCAEEQVRKWNSGVIALSIAITAFFVGAMFMTLRYVLREYNLSGNSVPARLSISEVVDEVTISQWRLIGPFNLAPGNPTTDQDGFKSDYLATLGYPETSLTEGSVATLCKRIDICRIYSGHGAVIPLFRFFPNNSKSVVYATAGITCKHDIDIVIEVGYNQGVLAWVNGHLIVSVPVGDKGGVATKYRDLYEIHLRQGNNLLVIKSDSGNDSQTWALITSLMSLKSARDKYIEKADGNTLATRLLKPGDHLIIQVPKLSGNLPVHVEIANWKGTIAISQSYDLEQALSIDTKHLPNLAIYLTPPAPSSSVLGCE